MSLDEQLQKGRNWDAAAPHTIMHQFLQWLIILLGQRLDSYISSSLHLNYVHRVHMAGMSGQLVTHASWMQLARDKLFADRIQLQKEKIAAANAVRAQASTPVPAVAQTGQPHVAGILVAPPASSQPLLSSTPLGQQPSTPPSTPVGQQSHPAGSPQPTDGQGGTSQVWQTGAGPPLHPTGLPASQPATSEAPGVSGTSEHPGTPAAGPT